MNAAAATAGVVTEEMVRRALDAQPFASSRNSSVRVWQLFDGHDAEDVIRAVVEAALGPSAPAKEGTPSSRWAANGEPDPHGKRYDCERAALAHGDMTDDELANAVSVHCSGSSIATIGLPDAAKDRIRWLSRRLAEATAAKEPTTPAAPKGGEAPVDMLLFCPKCATQHVDAPDERTPGWGNPPHRSHLCHACGHIWRPADVPTNGVASLATKGERDGSAVPATPAGGGGEDANGLLPCPFCGRTNCFDQWPCEWLDGSGANVIRCAWCHGAAPAKTWNRRLASTGSAPSAEWEATDADIAAWLERHDLEHTLRGTDARCAFEDARSAHMIAATPTQQRDHTDLMSQQYQGPPDLSVPSWIDHENPPAAAPTQETGT